MHACTHAWRDPIFQTDSRQNRQIHDDRHSQMTKHTHTRIMCSSTRALTHTHTHTHTHAHQSSCVVSRALQVHLDDQGRIRADHDDPHGHLMPHNEYQNAVYPDGSDHVRRCAPRRVSQLLFSQSVSTVVFAECLNCCFRRVSQLLFLQSVSTVVFAECLNCCFRILSQLLFYWSWSPSVSFASVCLVLQRMLDAMTFVAVGTVSALARISAHVDTRE
jgi:hypothetical protein